MSEKRQDQSAGHKPARSGRRRSISLAAASLVPGLMWAAPALAHGSERGFVLLLPTGYYLAGGTVAVAASFALIAFAPAALITRLASARLRLGSLPAVSPVPTSLAAFLLLALLIAAGFHGSRDPLENPLPLAIWTLWWVGITLLHAIVGNLWTCINPWTGPYRLAARLGGSRVGRLAYPSWLGYWPAVALFLAFAWFELVYPAPDDPERLAVAVGLYWLLAFLGMLVFGERAWMEKAEPFTIFFRLVGSLSPLGFERTAEGQVTAFLAWPGARLVNVDPLPLSGVLFVLLTLSSVSFDGLSRTFWWLALANINPLEFPGRSAVVDRNSAGLLLALIALAAAYWCAVWLGWVLAGKRAPLASALGAFVLSIVPISIAFHVAHYLTAILVNGQYALIAASDPFGTGLDLFGTRDRHVTASFLNLYESVRLIWNLQILAIVVGHVAGIATAHAVALRLFGDARAALASQAPLAAMMVLYTLFGLWLLSTPTAG